MKVIAILLALTPSFVHKNIRRMMGASIGKGSRIRFGTILLSKNINIGNKTKIGPFSYLSGQEIRIGDHSKLKLLSAVSSRVIKLGNYVHVSPLAIISGDHSENSIFNVGNHSRFFPFCWVETGEGVTIGSNVGIGGHTLIFTHGVWPDYIDGGPVAHGPVVIEDNVWLPWRVFIMPNVTIGKNAIIGANSTVTKSIEGNVVAAGSPAKTVNNTAILELSEEQKLERVQYILSEFSKEYSFKTGENSKLEKDTLELSGTKIFIDSYEKANAGDLVFFINTTPSDEQIKKINSSGISIIDHREKKMKIQGKNSTHNQFVDFLRKYGIRLSSFE